MIPKRSTAARRDADPELVTVAAMTGDQEVGVKVSHGL